MAEQATAGRRRRGRRPAGGARAEAPVVHRVRHRQPTRVGVHRARDRRSLPGLGDDHDHGQVRDAPPGGEAVAMASLQESSVAPQPPGWAQRFPRDERLFMWIVIASVAVMSAFVIGWLAWGNQNVPTASYATSTRRVLGAGRPRSPTKYTGADGLVHVPPGAGRLRARCALHLLPRARPEGEREVPHLDLVRRRRCTASRSSAATRTSTSRSRPTTRTA